MTYPGFGVESDRELFVTIHDLLKQGHKVKLTVSGNSMRPFLTDKRDQVLLEEIVVSGLRRGDIILYHRYNGRCILHRIQKKVNGGCITIGDAYRYSDGMVNASDILAKVIRIYRKGREIDCSSALWRLVSAVWLALLPCREQVIYILKVLSRIRCKYKLRVDEDRG